MLLPWSQQPQYLARVDRGHPLGAALDYLWVCRDNGNTDIIRGLPAPNSSNTLVATRQGRAVANTGGAGTAVAFQAGNRLPYIQVALGYFSSSAGNYALSQLTHSSGGNLARLTLSSGTALALQVQHAFGTTRTITITTGVGSSLTPHLWLMVSQIFSGTDYHLYADGQQASGTLDAGTFSSLDRVQPPGGTLNGGVLLTGFGFGRALPHEYLRNFTTNPANAWKLLAPRRRLFMLGVPAGAGATVEVPAGALTLTGNAPTVVATANQFVAVPAGALSLSGFSPTVLSPRTVAVPAGTITLTGFAPDVRVGATIQVPAGALSLTGFSPVVSTTATVAVEAGALTLTGYAPLVIASGSRAVGAGRSRRQKRVIEIDGRDIVVESAEHAQALLDKAREEAKATADLAIKRAANAQRRPTRKVLADARRLLVEPEIQVPQEFEQMAVQARLDIAETYRQAIRAVEIAALLARQQRMEEDDEDVLLLLV